MGPPAPSGNGNQPRGPHPAGTDAGATTTPCHASPRMGPTPEGPVPPLLRREFRVAVRAVRTSLRVRAVWGVGGTSDRVESRTGAPGSGVGGVFGAGARVGRERRVTARGLVP